MPPPGADDQSDRPVDQGDARQVTEMLVAMSVRQHELIQAAEEARRQAEASAAELRASELRLRASERRFRAFADTAPAILWITEADGACSFLTNGWYEFTGQSAETALGAGWLDAIHPDDRDGTGWVFRQANDQQRPFAMDYRLRRADGQYRWAIGAGRPRFDDGRFLGFVGSVIDCDDRKRAEMAVRDRERQLRELNAALDDRVREQTQELLAGRERLRALTSQLAKAEQRERRRLASVLHDHVQQLLVAAKMRVGRPEAGTPSVTQLLDEAIDATRSLAAELAPPLLYEQGLEATLRWLAQRVQQQHDLQVFVIAKESPASVGDEISELLFQIARELLLNVVKHAKTDCAWVELQRPGGELVLSVRDHGKGFDPAEAQARPASFGLFHARERVLQLGGRLRVDSEPGEGTQVIVTLPTMNSVAPMKAVILPERHPVGAAGRGLPLRVLLVDDHQVVRSGIAGMLASQSAVTVVGEAADGLEGVEKARELRPDVIVMDVNMPRMNGIDATRRIKAELPGTRVIALSLHKEAEVARAMRDAGADDYATKDAPAEDLIRAICGSRQQ